MALLLSAAVMKLPTLATPGDGVIAVFALIAAQLEIAIALWLVSGLRPAASWWVALMMFSFFTAISLTKAIQGDSSCGCFGSVQIPPWWTALLDMAVIVFLLACRRSVKLNASNPGCVRRALLATSIGIAAFSLPVAIVADSFRPVGSSLAQGWDDYGEIAVLDPAQWTGRRLPFETFIDVGKELVRGRWRVAIVHHDCPKCQELLSHFADGDGRKLAVIQIPPNGDLLIDAGDALVGKLTSNKEWIVQTPVEFLLHDGNVIEVMQPK